MCFSPAYPSGRWVGFIMATTPAVYNRSNHHSSKPAAKRVWFVVLRTVCTPASPRYGPLILENNYE